MKNDYEIRGDVTAIFIKSKKYGKMETLISTDKLTRVMEFPNTWCLNWSETSRSFYIQGAIHNVDNKKRSSVILHRWLTRVADGMEVDHFDHDTLNNTDANLRVVTLAQNRQNHLNAQRNSKSGIRGVSWHKHTKKWKAAIKINKKTIHLGYYHDIKEAEIVVREARSQHMPYSQERLQIENPDVKKIITKSKSSRSENPIRSKSGHRNVYWRSGRNEWFVAFFVGTSNKEFGWFKNLTKAIERAEEVREMLSKQKSS